MTQVPYRSQHQSDMFELVAHALNVAYMEWRVDTNEVHFSRALYDLFGEDPRTKWTPERVFDTVHHDDASDFRAAVVAFFKSREDRAVFSFRWGVARGGYRWLRYHATVQRDAAGRVTRLVGAITDITKEKEQEATNRALLARQAATIEVLRAISDSPADPQPVFELIARRVRELYGAHAVNVVEYDGSLMHIRAMIGHEPEATARLLAAFPRPAGMETGPGRAILSGRPSFNRDPSADRGLIQAGREVGGGSYLGVPLLHEGGVVGVLGLWLAEKGEFNDALVDIAKAFAEQAVIAIAGAKTLRSLRERTAELAERNTAFAERIDHQAATIDVLRAMSASPGDPQPVFDLIVRRAAEICGNPSVVLFEYDGQLLHWRARVGDHIFPSLQIREQFLSMYPMPLHRGSVACRTILDGKIIHVRDVSVDPELSDTFRSLGTKSVLGVPIFRDGKPVGVIGLNGMEAGGFTDTQVSLLQTFGEQAAIAIASAETYRALQTRTSDLQESLNQQTAMNEVLQVINRHPGDLIPVFDAILDKAMRLCEATFGILATRDGPHFQTAVTHGVPAAFAEYRRHNPPNYGPGTTPVRLLAGERTVHILDLKAEDVYAREEPNRRALVDLGGARTSLTVALGGSADVAGFIQIYRQDVRSFSEEQVNLLQTSAAQATIAMENARLLSDLQEALDYQTASGDVLKVISQTTYDLQPVLDTLVRTASRLCDSDMAFILRRDGDLFHAAASFGFSTEYQEFLNRHPLGIDRGSTTGRVALEMREIQIPDVAADPEYTLTESTRLSGQRTALGVPLVKDGVLLGVILFARRRVEPYTDKQIEIIRGFADQAVIAIENIRLLTEQREALERQTATAEILSVINASPGDLMPVFDAMLERGMQLCGAVCGGLFTYDGREFHTAATLGVPPALAAYRAHRPPNAAPGNRVAQLLQTRQSVQTLDVTETDAYRAGDAQDRAMADLGGARTILNVPLLKDGAVTGFLSVYRQEVRAFSDRQVELLENFAAQAVIAMENARLINEIRAARDHAEATLRELKIAQANLVQSEKMASLGQLTAGIAHEIKNPLNFVNNFAALSVDLLAEFQESAAPAIALLTDDQRDDIEDVAAMLTTNLRKIEEHGKRADGIVRAMLEHSRGASGERREVDLNALVDEALNLAYHGARAQDQNFNITLERDFATDLPPIEVNPQDLTRVFLNIFSNGFYAANKRARSAEQISFEPALKVTTRDVGGFMEIRIRDNGAGIPPDIRDKLFQPFFTTKPTGEGTGLGLSITYDIVTKQHGGTITVDSEPGNYTEFTVSLPRHMFVTEGERA